MNTASTVMNTAPSEHCPEEPLPTHVGEGATLCVAVAMMPRGRESTQQGVRPTLALGSRVG